MLGLSQTLPLFVILWAALVNQTNPQSFNSLNCQLSVLSTIQREYGAAARAQNVTLPDSLFFLSQNQTTAFHNDIKLMEIQSGHVGHTVHLQDIAAMAFLDARAEIVETLGVNLTLGRHKSGLRSFNDTLEIWNRNQSDARCSQSNCIAKACSLEKSDFLNRIRSTALPGTSQHHLGTAIDIEQWDDSLVRDIMAKHGFHRTVLGDRPHFTYLGVADPLVLGLTNRQGYWLVNPPT